MTFSIIARCPRSGQLGVGVATAVPAVGSTCPYVEAGVGAVSTQSWINPHLALEILASLRGGATAQEALDAAIARDPGYAIRQLGVVDAEGRSASWSGKDCTVWFGQIVEPGFAIQGNMLVGEDTLTAMAQAFKESAEQPLDERLMRALEAGDEAGGDKRGKQSAALIVYGTQPYSLLDLRVDVHSDPVSELRRIYPTARFEAMPFIAQMPKFLGDASPVTADVLRVLGLSPAQRAAERGAISH